MNPYGISSFRCHIQEVMKTNIIMSSPCRGPYRWRTRPLGEKALIPNQQVMKVCIWLICFGYNFVNSPLFQRCWDRILLSYIAFSIFRTILQPDMLHARNLRSSGKTWRWLRMQMSGRELWRRLQEWVCLFINTSLVITSRLSVEYQLIRNRGSPVPYRWSSHLANVNGLLPSEALSSSIPMLYEIRKGDQWWTVRLNWPARTL